MGASRVMFWSAVTYSSFTAMKALQTIVDSRVRMRVAMACALVRERGKEERKEGGKEGGREGVCLCACVCLFRRGWLFVCLIVGVPISFGLSMPAIVC